MIEFKTYKLGELIDVQNGYAFKSDDLKTIGIPIIKIKNIQPPNISIEDADRYPHEISERLKQFVVKKKDILISMTGSHVSQISSAVGKVGRYGFDKPSLLNQRVGKLYSKDENVLNNDFLYYYIARPEIQFELATNAGGSANQANISPQDIKELDIEIPDLLTQTRIAAILSALDDKIELNRLTNETLEKIAETLFKKYFVEGIDEENLPEEWRMDKVSNLFNLTIGRTPPRIEKEWFSNNPEDIKWISIKDMGTSGVYISETSEYLTKEAVKRFTIPQIPENTVVLSFKLTVGRVSISSETMLSNEAIAHFIPKSSTYLTPEFIYLFLKNFEYESLGNTSSIATAVNSQTIKGIDMLVPDKKSIDEFSLVANSIFKKIKNNQEEIKSLRNTRDSLLPKLMLGEIEVQIDNG